MGSAIGIGLGIGFDQVRSTGVSFPASLLSDAVAIHESDSGVYKEVDLTLAANNDPVAQIRDLTGHGYHLLQAVGANQPLLITNVKNGMPAVRCDGVNDFVASTTLPASVDGKRTFFLVTRGLTVGGAPVPGKRFFGINGTIGGCAMFDNSGVYSYFGNSSILVQSLGSVSINDYLIYAFKTTSLSSMIAYMNGVALSSFNPHDDFNTDGLWIGSYLGAAVDSSNCDWFADSMFNRDLTAPELALMFTYYSSKYAIAI